MMTVGTLKSALFKTSALGYVWLRNFKISKPGTKYNFNQISSGI